MERSKLVISGNSYAKSRILGIGRNRKRAARRIMEATAKIIRAERQSSDVRFTERHFVVNVDEIKLDMHAPYCFRLDAVSESKYLSRILMSDPIREPFGIDIWTPDQKVLSAQ